MTNTKEIENATLEAIYWWNRNESYYHNCFVNLDKIYLDKAMLGFFATKIFDVFLREYSIRRNIKSGHENVNRFLEDLFQHQFIKRVKSGEIELIDTLSDELKCKGDYTENQTKSLLSKLAFLINPNIFSLLDNLAKESLWGELNNAKKIFTKGKLNSYAFYIERVNELINKNDIILENQKLILNNFKDTPAYTFFSENPNAFKRRIIDKYLWIRKQNQNEKSRKIENESYLQFVKLGILE